MSQKFKLPDLGEGIHESEILEIPVAVGDEIEEDETILTVETDKAAVDIPSPFSGTIEEIHIEEGDIVNVGDVLLTFSGGNGASGDESTETEQQEAEAKEAESATSEEQASDEAEEEKADTEAKDTQTAQKERTKSEGHPVPAAPSTRRLAREMNVDLADVDGSGPGGRVTSEDVKAYAEGEQPARKSKEETEAPARETDRETETPQQGKAREKTKVSPELPDFSKWGEIERRSLRSVRRATARKMEQSWSQIPHVSHHDRADVTELEELRQQYQREMGLENLTMTAFILKATVAALKKYPRFNASLDTTSDEIILKHYYNIGIAVDTERGLIVPVIADADSKNLQELSDEINALVKQTRDGETGLEQMQGGTFTITNVGPIGGRHFDPIINFPQAAILGVAQVDWEPVVITKDNRRDIEPRLLMPLVVAFDHRLVDGAEAARFLNDIIAMLEDPDKFMLRL